ncbi:MAG: hypothetical protein GQ570_11775 [Helicobacteraceae bacterium]|nr:hypothetical protein [Helicobacteraceae bacterium]
MSKNSFSLDLSAFSNLTEHKLKLVVKKSFIELSKEIIETSPVDEGRFRANWMPAVGGYDSSTTESEDEQKAIRNVIKEANTYKSGDLLTLTNNLPYAEAIEFGLYGDGQKTVGGFSKKAPSGVVGVNILRWSEYVERYARKYKK